MAEIIAVCGSPASGKTTAGLKIAQEIYFRKKQPVLFLSPDWNKPSLAYLFPRRKTSDLYSLGTALDHTTVTSEDLLKSTVYSDQMKNFGFLGFKTGESRSSYPVPTEDKVLSLFRSAGEVAGNLVVDCSSCFDDPISAIAVREADWIVQLIVPDLRSMGYYATYEERYRIYEEKTFKVLNRTDNDVFLPEQEVKEHFGTVLFSLPYSRELKQQSVSGTLPGKLTDMKFRKECAAMVEMLL